MSKTLRVLAVDQFLARDDEGSWLEWRISRDPDGKPFVTTDEGHRVDQGDYVLTTINGDRFVMKHIDFQISVRDTRGIITHVEVADGTYKS